MAKPEADPGLRTSVNQPYILNHHHRILCLPPLLEPTLFSIRLGGPLMRMNEIYGVEFRATEPHRVAVEDREWANTIIFQRESNPRLLEMMRRFQRAGKRVVFDVDDLLVDVPDYLTVAQY
jgi:hypothetical protein